MLLVASCPFVKTVIEYCRRFDHNSRVNRQAVIVSQNISGIGIFFKFREGYYRLSAWLGQVKIVVVYTQTRGRQLFLSKVNADRQDWYIYYQNFSCVRSWSQVALISPFLIQTCLKYYQQIVYECAVIFTWILDSCFLIQYVSVFPV